MPNEQHHFAFWRNVLELCNNR